MTMEPPMITVVVPVYKTEDYLYKCLNSIKNQSFNAIEILIVNDCTPDNAMLIAEKFASEDERFKIIHHDQNKGLGAARNTGINHARGKYIAFLDSDDAYSFDALRALYTCAELNNADMVIGRMFQHDESKDSLVPVEYIEARVRFFLQLPFQNIRKCKSENFYSGNVANNLYRLSLFKNSSIRFIEDKVYFEDMPASLELWFHSRNIVAIPDIVHFRTVRNDASNLSITQTFNKKAFYDRTIIIDYIYNFCLKYAAPANDLLDLTLEILKRISNTTKLMLNQINDDSVKDEIINNWYPTHVSDIEKKINYIKKLQNEWSEMSYG